MVLRFTAMLMMVYLQHLHRNQQLKYWQKINGMTVIVIGVVIWVLKEGPKAPLFIYTALYYKNLDNKNTYICNQTKAN